jgi:hypothetical protein
VNITPTYAVGNDPYSKINTTGLVAWYKMDENTGTSLADASGNGHTGTLTGGYTWVSGKYNNAVKFDGSTGYASIPSGVLSNQSNATVICFINETSFKQYGSYVSDWINPVSTSVFCLGYEQNQGYPEFWVSNGANANHIESAYPMSYNKWHMVAGVYNGNIDQFGDSYTSIWVDTNKTTPFFGGISKLNPANSSVASIGKHSTVWFSNSGFDEVLIYNRALNDTEIKQIYYDGMQSLQLKTNSDTQYSSSVVGSASNLSIPYSSSDASITGFTATVPNTVTQNGVVINNYPDTVTPFSINSIVPVRSDINTLAVTSDHLTNYRVSITPTMDYNAGGTLTVYDSALNNYLDKLSMSSSASIPN